MRSDVPPGGTAAAIRHVKIRRSDPVGAVPGSPTGPEVRHALEARMTKRWLVCLAVGLAALSASAGSLLGAGGASAQQPAGGPPPAISSDQATLNQYCAGCHNNRTRTAGLVLDGIDWTRVG